MEHLRPEDLEAGLDPIRDAPADAGTVELIVRRPAVDEREVLEQAEIAVGRGLVGDTWPDRPSTSGPDGGPNPEAQITLMGARVIDLLAGDRDRWPMAGDQLFVDLDLGVANLPAGSRLQVGSAILEVSAKPHTGCAKFSRRFGADALRFVNSPVGRDLRLRGVNARVAQGGIVRRGDAVRKVDGPGADA